MSKLALAAAFLCVGGEGHADYCAGCGVIVASARYDHRMIGSWDGSVRIAPAAGVLLADATYEHDLVGWCSAGMSVRCSDRMRVGFQFAIAHLTGNLSLDTRDGVIRQIVRVELEEKGGD